MHYEEPNGYHEDPDEARPGLIIPCSSWLSLRLASSDICAETSVPDNIAAIASGCGKATTHWSNLFASPISFSAAIRSTMFCGLVVAGSAIRSCGEKS